ncbi:protease s8 tripeptidyl peptidase [Niveomyces insectorum RCEF 264]|uniref:tripeptidyl-peptidase II n=1 Tax=Niveomyces insectorum RCEF 264 TaxID=1081102 RepID=A0A167TB35_9HYPO|nr:protease s8 tripeptidyl peptidase [Niveomyces insectorum RCEF 264]
MRFDLLATVLATLAVATEASPRFRSAAAGAPLSKRHTNHVLHETRSPAAAHTWRRAAKVPGDAVLPMRIGLTQRNLDRAEQLLNDVSHPDSPNYGRHWTAEQVADMFAPAPAAIDAVLAWLAEDGGLGPDRVRLSRGRNWVLFNATVAEAEALFQTEYHVYTSHARQHGGGGRSQVVQHVGCEQYHVPAHIREHIDLVLPTVHRDARPGPSRSKKTAALPPGDAQTELKKRARLLRRRSSSTRYHTKREDDDNNNVVVNSAAITDARPQKGILGSPLDASLPKKGATITNALMSLDQCDTMITPACLQALYGIPAGSGADANNTLGIVEYTPQAILQSDLNLYFSQFQPSLQGKGPRVQLLDNAVLQTTNQSFNFNGESALDLEFAMALIFPQTATLFQVGDLDQGASFNNFLDSIDGSYCAFAGGGSTNPNVDGQYSDGIECGVTEPTHVISTSYSYNEGDLTPAYEQRQCNEYMKLGLRGVTIVYSSGDFGVAGNGNTCIDPQTGAYNNGTAGQFNPSFPGSCPYVTSVGATQLPNGTSIRDLRQDANVPSPETACETVIFSGGGFSNVFGMPSYQQAAVAAYFRQSAPPYGADRFNNSQAVRGYPDVAANGANYVTAVDGNFTLSFGTSASAPTFASVLNLINEQRLQAGKAPVGFVNPVLYANPQVLNDITAGNNPGCGTKGFAAVPGWDPLTGLGTPNYPAMEKLFLSLP